VGKKEEEGRGGLVGQEHLKMHGMRKEKMGINNLSENAGRRGEGGYGEV